MPLSFVENKTRFSHKDHYYYLGLVVLRVSVKEILTSVSSATENSILLAASLNMILSKNEKQRP